jgi:hypothetical protein
MRITVAKQETKRTTMAAGNTNRGAAPFPSKVSRIRSSDRSCSCHSNLMAKCVTLFLLGYCMDFLNQASRLGLKTPVRCREHCIVHKRNDWSSPVEDATDVSVTFCQTMAQRKARTFVFHNRSHGYRHTALDLKPLVVFLSFLPSCRRRGCWSTTGPSSS